MARAAIRCPTCSTPLRFHCPDSNTICTWLACLHPPCLVRYLDIGRGLIQHTDGSIVGWGDMPTTSEPPTITIEDTTTDGGTTAPDA